MDRLGRYEILEELGRGAMGTVYRARDPKIDRIVAIKTIQAVADGPAQQEEYRKRFFREAQAAGKLSHPGIVTIHDVGEEESTQTPYLVMEYIAGRTLESALTADSADRPALETCLELVKQVAEALDCAHAQKIVHRDIKPTNVIVTPEGRAKITDFGVAKLTQTEFTVPGQLMGTPAYISPEQLKGEAVDGRTDFFSLGVILYWILTGEKPFTGDAVTVCAKILYQDPVPVTQRNPALRPEFDSVVNRALAKDPAARYQRGKELAKDLDDLLRGRALRLRSRAFLQPPAERTIVQNPLEPLPLEKTVLLNSAGPLNSTASPERTPARSPAVAGNVGQFVGDLPIAVRLALLFFGLTLLVSLLVVRPGDKPVQPVSLFSILKPVGKANLHVICYHGFRAAEISIWVDGDLVHEDKLTGGSDEGFKLFKKRTGANLSTTVRVPAGNRKIRVRVKSANEGYERTKSIDGDFAKDGEKTLEISFGRWDNELHLSWQD